MAASLVAWLRRVPAARAHSAAPLETILAGIDEALRARAGASRRLFDGKRALLGALEASIPSRPAARLLGLKVLNILVARSLYRRRAVRLWSKPLSLTVDPCNSCHLACPGCVHSAGAEARKGFRWEGGMLDRFRFDALLRQFGPCAIHCTLCNYGEPLLNPETPRMIRRAKAHLMATAISSNLSLTRFDAEALVLSGLDLLAVSVDGATQRVYERFRRGGNLALVLDNMSRLAAAKRALGKRTPVIAWHFLAFEHNAAEIPAAIETAVETGANEFRVVRPFDVSWDDPEIRPAKMPHRTVPIDSGNEEAILANWNPFPDDIPVETVEHELARWPGTETDTRLPESAVPANGPTCEWLYKNITMDAGGTFMPCCCAPQPGVNVVFGRQDAPGDPFNSVQYRLARMSFGSRAAFEAEQRAPGAPAAPYCANCEWEKGWAEPNPLQMDEYLKIAGGRVFTSGVRRWLVCW